MAKRDIFRSERFACGKKYRMCGSNYRKKEGAMIVLEIARIYTDLVETEREIPEEEPQAKEKARALRTKYHELLMAKMREERIDFSDRFDAAAKAFDFVREENAKYGDKQL